MTKDFTVLVKNTIEFPDLGAKYIRRNIIEKNPDKAKEAYLQNCIYNPKTDPYCPTFRIGDIVERAGFKYDQVAKTVSWILIVEELQKSLLESHESSFLGRCFFVEN